MLIPALSKIPVHTEAEEKKQGRFFHATVEEHCEKLTLSYGFIAADLLSTFHLTRVKYFPNNTFCCGILLRHEYLR